MENIPEKPLRTGIIETGTHYRLIERPEKLILCRNHNYFLGGLFFVGLAILTPPLVNKVLLKWGFSIPFKVLLTFSGFLLFGGVVTLMIGYFVRLFSRQYEFINASKTFRILKQKTVEKEIDLAKIEALQINYTCYISKKREPGSSKETVCEDNGFELNLVFRDQEKLQRNNLISAASRRSILRIGKKLSQKLHITLLDHATQKHIKEEQQKMRESFAQSQQRENN